MAFQEETEALLTSLRNLASLACLVDATSIKDINSGLLNGAGTHKKAILPPAPFHDHSLPSAYSGKLCPEMAQQRMSRLLLQPWWCSGGV